MSHLFDSGGGGGGSAGRKSVVYHDFNILVFRKYLPKLVEVAP